MKINKLESAFILTENLVQLGPHAHEKEIYDEVYAFLDYLEVHNAGDEEQLDEEEEIELSAGIEFFSDLGAADIESEFSEFSPSVGTSEGTDELAALMFGDGHLRTAHIPAGVEVGQYQAQRAPVGERVYNTQSIIGEAFQPCGAD